MKRKFFLKSFFLCLMVCFFIVVLTNLTYSQEKLSLTGIIKGVDPINGIVRIQVTGEQCKGLWNFKFPDYAKDDLDKSIVGRRLQFTIDSPVCDPNRLHTIVLER